VTGATVAAFVASALAAGGWAGMRWSEASRDIERNLAALVMAIDIDNAAEASEDR